MLGTKLMSSTRFRRISHSLNVFPLYDGEKECRGYTLFSHLITMEKKSVLSNDISEVTPLPLRILE